MVHLSARRLADCRLPGPNSNKVIPLKTIYNSDEGNKQEHPLLCCFSSDHILSDGRLFLCALVSSFLVDEKEQNSKRRQYIPEIEQLGCAAIADL
jgi:hypothetical protein